MDTLGRGHTEIELILTHAISLLFSVYLFNVFISCVHAPLSCVSVELSDMHLCIVYLPCHNAKTYPYDIE